MPRIVVTIRPSSDLRCAFCHGELSLEMRPCRSCFTALHDECWDEAGVCPTLGCATWMRLIRILPRRVLASWWHLGWWLTAFLGIVAIYTLVVPAFVKMFVETGLSLSALTGAVFALSLFACSWLGAATVLAVVGVSVSVFLRYRTWRWLGPALSTLALLALGFAIVTAYAVFPPIVICQKL